MSRRNKLFRAIGKRRARAREARVRATRAERREVGQIMADMVRHHSASATKILPEPEGDVAMSVMDEIGPVGEMPDWKVLQIGEQLRELGRAAVHHASPAGGRNMAAARKALAKARALLGPEREAD